MDEDTLPLNVGVVVDPLRRLGFLLLKLALELPVAYGIAAGAEFVVLNYVDVPQSVLTVSGYAPAFRTLVFVIVITGGFCWSIPKSKFLAGEN